MIERRRFKKASNVYSIELVGKRSILDSLKYDGMSNYFVQINMTKVQASTLVFILVQNNN